MCSCYVGFSCTFSLPDPSTHTFMIIVDKCIYVCFCVHVHITLAFCFQKSTIRYQFIQFILQFWIAYQNVSLYCYALHGTFTSIVTHSEWQYFKFLLISIIMVWPLVCPKCVGPSVYTNIKVGSNEDVAQMTTTITEEMLKWYRHVKRRDEEC